MVAGSEGEVRARAPSEDEVAEYVAEISAQLAVLAKRPRFRELRRILEMAHLEAKRNVRAPRSTLLQ